MTLATKEQLAQIRKSSRNTSTVSRGARSKGHSSIPFMTPKGNIPLRIQSSFAPNQFSAVQLKKIMEVVLTYAERENEGEIPSQPMIRKIANWVY